MQLSLWLCTATTMYMYMYTCKFVDMINKLCNAPKDFRLLASLRPHLPPLPPSLPTLSLLPSSFSICSSASYPSLSPSLTPSPHCQVYNESIRDLLGSSLDGGSLELREDSKQGLVVSNLSKHQVCCTCTCTCIYVVHVQECSPHKKCKHALARAWESKPSYS